MRTPQRPSGQPITPRALAATILATATAAALTTSDRLAAAHTAIHQTTPPGPVAPGHADLARREAAYRLADAAHLEPRGLLTPNLAQALDNRDRAWPRPIRRTALLTATAHLPATPIPTPDHPVPTRTPVPTPDTTHLAHLLHTTARRTAAQLRTTIRPRTLTQLLATTARDAANLLPDGYGLLLECELTLRLARVLGLPTPGALAPGLGPTLALATRNTTRTELADLLLTAVRPAPARPAVAAGSSERVPRQRARAGTCSCPCATGGFCGGCGHAGCGGR
ncbi:hypothetical protein GCM10009665_01550 [Kitasatospora nipponensis]|uniref:Secreted protein n=1 Tax=Kitasatospora nipponensis TaxID=258049 RepID=A0ABP4G6B1_9ACTN